ncbi:hypothetical protein DZA20_25900 [Pseudomonas aeruginosa]|uniref:hypothetical protein n=1 Tax=Pseudomonas aeruginosa TaxID=287 RepID=UPI000F838892|nr:hypothetical protein [Pseudomonas aeruginosa]RTX53425.1 hypothetical protein DZA20_25900 [Pseudomonas aeruginosa]
MHLAIDYGDEPVEVVETTSLQLDHLIPKSHKARVSEVSLIIGAALKRRAFFKDLQSLSSGELLSADSPYHKKYSGHLKELASIPYDGYHTEYSQWESQFGEKGLGATPRILSTDLREAVAAFISGLSLEESESRLIGPPQIALGEEAKSKKPSDAGNSKGLPDQDHGKTFER